jgi:hypothetical protein
MGAEPAYSKLIMSTVKGVAKRIEREVGLSPAISFRIAHKLNEMAKAVPWATPVADGGARRRLARRKAAKGKR